MSRVFISYKRANRDLVLPIRERIEQALGESCWIDLDGIESDAQFVSVIMRAIKETEVVLFMYSEMHTHLANIGQDWTIRELNFAQSKQKRIVFVNLDQTPLSDWFEFMFPQQQQVDATSPEAIDRLIDDLKRWLHVMDTKSEAHAAPASPEPIPAPASAPKPKPEPNPAPKPASQPEPKSAPAPKPAPAPESKLEPEPARPRFCRKCGTPLAPGAMFCKKCGTKINL
jgi:hypothetical protein